MSHALAIVDINWKDSRNLALDSDNIMAAVERSNGPLHSPAAPRIGKYNIPLNIGKTVSMCVFVCVRGSVGVSHVVTDGCLSLPSSTIAFHMWIV